MVEQFCLDYESIEYIANNNSQYKENKRKWISVVRCIKINENWQLQLNKSKWRLSLPWLLSVVNKLPSYWNWAVQPLQQPFKSIDRAMIWNIFQFGAKSVVFVRHFSWSVSVLIIDFPLNVAAGCSRFISTAFINDFFYKYLIISNLPNFDAEMCTDSNTKLITVCGYIMSKSSLTLFPTKPHIFRIIYFCVCLPCYICFNNWWFAVKNNAPEPHTQTAFNIPHPMEISFVLVSEGK